jgi:ribosomal protein S18 acetylase RimI-like enzyme
MEFISRPATLEDVEIIKDLANSQLLSLNPKEKAIGDSEALNLVRGFVDPAITRLIKSQNNENWQSFLTLNPDKSRKRSYLDIYTRPDAPTLPTALNLALSLAKDSVPDYQLWIGVSAEDKRYREFLESNNFLLLRKYWLLEMDLTDQQMYDSPNSANIREIDLDIEEEIRSFYSVNQDSFSKHFGFMPREYEEWKELVLRDREEVNLRVWLLSVDGKDVGFLDCNDELVHEESGYVAGLGVRLDYHSRGLGEALLRKAIQVSTERGLKKLCLNVDTGNESGALRLYKKVGMEPISEWHQYENLKWNEIETHKI